MALFSSDNTEFEDSSPVLGKQMGLCFPRPPSVVRGLSFKAAETAWAGDKHGGAVTETSCGPF